MMRYTKNKKLVNNILYTLLSLIFGLLIALNLVLNKLSMDLNSKLTEVNIKNLEVEKLRKLISSIDFDYEPASKSEVKTLILGVVDELSKKVNLNIDSDFTVYNNNILSLKIKIEKNNLSKGDINEILNLISSKKIYVDIQTFVVENNESGAKLNATLELKQTFREN